MNPDFEPLSSYPSLPFVGRRQELERLRLFWRGTVDAPGLRAMLVIGAAGVGKSRLVEELLRDIAGDGGTTVHTRIYPEASRSLVPLLAAALPSSESDTARLDTAEGMTTNELVGALRRLSRLRPTAIIIEDIHLLGRESVGELVLLLASLADEPISLVCSARPLEAAGRGILERYLVDEIELGPVGRADIEDLWLRMFGEPGSPVLMRMIAELTHGNLLAIGSAFRTIGASESPGVEPGRTGTGDAPTPSLRQRLEQDVAILSQGMAAHLSDEELMGACRLAVAGEVFSREAARLLDGDADRMIDLLTAAGILSTPVTLAFPLGTGSSHFPLLSFTHTLLHRHFVDNARPDPLALARLVAAEVPLYSILPFQLLAASPPDPRAADPATFERGIEQALRVAQWLDLSADWELALEVWATASMLATLVAEQLDREKRSALRIRLLLRKLALLRRELLSEEYATLLEEMESLTADPADVASAENRLVYHLYQYRRLSQQEYARTSAIWEDVERLVERIPDARFTQRYLEFLRDIVHFTVSRNDMATVRMVERRIEAILADPQTTPAFRANARVMIYRNLLPVFETAAELEQRMELLAELEKMTGRNDRNMQFRKTTFLEKIGRYDEVVRLSEEAIPQFRERGLMLSVATIRLAVVSARGVRRKPGADDTRADRDPREPR